MHGIVSFSGCKRLSYAKTSHKCTPTIGLMSGNYARHSPFLVHFLKGWAVGDLGGFPPPRTGNFCLVKWRKNSAALRAQGKARCVLHRANNDGAPRMARLSEDFVPPSPDSSETQYGQRLTLPA